MSKSITAVIPTRAGSERVKQKNIRNFADSNLSLLEIKIASVLKLLDAGLIDEVMINTNCPVSIETAKEHNIKYHRRDDYLASSKCDIREYWKDCAKHIDTDTLLLAQVTSPFISHMTYRECIAKFQQEECDSLMTVQKLKEYIWIDGKPLNYEWPDHPKSQNLPDDIHFLTFGVSLIDKKYLLDHGNLVGENPCFHELSGVEAVDIDTEQQFEFAEELYKKTNDIAKRYSKRNRNNGYFENQEDLPY
jgi:CMP-N-acetylneuraminic acid synthetase